MNVHYCALQMKPRQQVEWVVYSLEYSIFPGLVVEMGYEIVLVTGFGMEEAVRGCFSLLFE